MRRSRAERGFSIALGLFALVLAAYLFLSSPFFRLEKVYLSGDTQFTAADIMTITGLHLGQNLFDLDVNEITKRLLAEPRIAQAMVKRRLPAGLAVTIKERHAVAVLSAASSLWRVDSEGFVLDEAKKPQSYIVITVQDSVDKVIPGEDADNPGVRAAAAIAGMLPVELGALISEIHVTSTSQLDLKTRDGITVRFGAWRDAPEKIKVLGLLMQQMQVKGLRARMIDISVPSNPVVR